MSHKFHTVGETKSGNMLVEIPKWLWNKLVVEQLVRRIAALSPAGRDKAEAEIERLLAQQERSGQE